MSPAALPLALVLLGGLLLAGGSAAAQTVWYVDADATGQNTGASWTDAFTDLQDALAAAQPGDEVWVAEGVYKPTSGSDRTATFTMTSGIALYGGFDGTEEMREERDWTAHETVLSGNIGDPDDEEDNAYHVAAAIGADPTTVLDGFTVRDGEADAGASPHDRGGGLYIQGGSPTVRNVHFHDNDAFRAGGGLHAEGASPLVEDCLFEDNIANTGGGAHFEGSDPVLRRVTFRRNSASSLAFYAGSTGLVEDALIEDNSPPGPGLPALALYLDGSSPRFDRLTVRDNTGGVSASGAAIITGGSDPVFEDCLFENNTSDEAAALLVNDGDPLFLRTTFRDNRATATGGAVVVDLATPVFLFCRFERNRAANIGAVQARNSGIVLLGSTFAGNVSSQADRAGGALVVTGNPWQGRPFLVASTVFVGNEAGRGGAVAAYSVNEGDGRMVNVTFAGNRATSEGGGAIYAAFAGGLRVENAVLWGDEAPLAPGAEEVLVAEGAGLILAHSLVMGGCPAGATCTDVLDADPRFVRTPSPGPDERWGTDDDDDGDLRLRDGSPALDYGLEGLLPPDQWDLDGDGDLEEPLPVDVAGGPRVLGSSVDPGAHEGAVAVASEPGPEEPSALRVDVWPNPMRGAATLSLTVPEAGAVEVVLYDVLGREVAVLASGHYAAGRHALTFDASALPPGVYVVRVTARGAVSAPITLLR